MSATFYIEVCERCNGKGGRFIETGDLVRYAESYIWAECSDCKGWGIQKDTTR